MKPRAEVHGVWSPRFGHVVDVFRDHLEEGLEVGASFSAVLDGAIVLDLWGGSTDAAKTRPWQRDTLVNVWSTTKGVVALLVALLVDEGRLDYDAPVAHYWPEFGACGKEGITLADLLSHRAGMHAFHEPVTASDLLDFDRMVRLLERQPPRWPARSRTAYQARTFGFLAGELVRRAAGVDLGRALRERIAEPLGAELHVGVPEDADARVAEIVPPEPMPEALRGAPHMAAFAPAIVAMLGPDVASGRQALPPPEVLATMHEVFTNPVNPPGNANTRAWRAAQVPSSNGHGHARALATIYAPLATGGAAPCGMFLRRSTLRAMTAERSRDLDLTLGFPVRYGAGFTLNNGEFGPHEEAFGHRGVGGSLAFADPRVQVSVGYAMNRMLAKFGDAPGNDPRADRLVGALYSALPVKARSIAITPAQERRPA